jgi:hypothetical protein
MLRKTSSGALMTVILGAALLGPATAAVAAQLTLSPTSGAAGDTVSVSGSGFAGRTSGRLTFGSASLGAFKTNQRGGFGSTFAVPAGYSGRVAVTANVRTTSASAGFGVLVPLPPAPPPVTPPPATGTTWKPSTTTTWQIQLTGSVVQTVDAQVYDIDGFDNPASVVSSLRATGSRVVCYISAGSYEDWRPDAAKFPAAVLGKTNGWPGERWLDIRRLDLLSPIIGARMDMCKAKGFDAVDPDNVDGYTNSTGFPLSAADQLAYNRFLAAAAHARGMSIGLKNDLDQIAALVPSYDFAVNEQCFEYGECDTLKPFITAGKPVFNIEYQGSTGTFCPASRSLGFMSVKKTLSLDAFREKCW